MGSRGGLQDRADPTLPGWHLPYWCGSMPSPTRLKTVTLALWSDHCAVRHPSDRLGNQAIPPRTTMFRRYCGRLVNPAARN